LIKAIKSIYPDVELDVMVIPQTAGVLENNPNINELIIFNKRKNKIISFIKTLLLLRRNKYSIAITPHSSITTAWLLKLANIKVRIGFDRWSAAKYLTHKVPHLENMHKTEKNLELLKHISDDVFPIQTEMFPTEQMYSKAKKIADDLQASTKKTIAIAPGSVWFTKKWPTEYYKELLRNLVEMNYGIILIGSKDEEDICNEIMPTKNSINLAGKLSLLESAAIISICDLMICNDSGALHIANAMQTDVFAFFGPTVQSIGYYPFRKHDFVFELEMECRPCGSHGGNTCPLNHHSCMRDILPNIVIEKVKEKFGE
jgi:heptosyltransferase-2